MSILPKTNYRSNTIQVKKIKKEILKFILKLQKTSDSQWNPEKKKNKTLGNTWTDFKLYYKTVEMKIMVLAEKQTHRSMEQNWEPRNKSTHIWAIDLQ